MVLDALGGLLDTAIDLQPEIDPALLLASGVLDVPGTVPGSSTPNRDVATANAAEAAMAAAAHAQAAAGMPDPWASPAAAAPEVVNPKLLEHQLQALAGAQRIVSPRGVSLIRTDNGAYVPVGAPPQEQRSGRRGGGPPKQPPVNTGEAPAGGGGGKPPAHGSRKAGDIIPWLIGALGLAGAGGVAYAMSRPDEQQERDTLS